MSGQPSTPNPTLLDDASRGFVRRAMAGGLVELDDVKKVVASLLADQTTLTPESLAEGLVAAGILTDWQSQKVLAGKSKGFYLGSYRLLRPLGRGGMGMVFLGEHQIMKRLMALKILPSEQLADERRIQRFKDEARASAQLDHPNIVRAYDCAEAGGKVYIVMEYVDGADLQQAVARDGVMPVATAIDAVRQAAEGLSHAHARGIIHRDIKPSNLMLGRDGVVKVSDMGLARIGFDFDDGGKSSKRLTGTADYVAPEQAIDSRSIDSRADIYSLGCTFYFLLTGRPPFSGSSLQQRLAKHQTAPVPDVRSVRDDCPVAVADLVKRMMAKRPSDRPPSMSDLLVQLKQIRGVPTTDQTGSLRSFAHPDDTTSMATSGQHTVFEESSISSSGGDESGLSGDPTESLDGFDFSDLPDLPAPGAASAADSMGPLGPASPPPPPRAVGRTTGGKAESDGGGNSQQVLLGIGLAFAALALVAVLGMMAYTFSRPLEQSRPRLKQFDSKDGTLIIVDE
ncbi:MULTISPECIES: serine/threonine-protein kinase [Crateriforma]|uniref:Serine/threonine-protein kinase PrkC n=1 Tax=Crateriforma conspicua TaxID=2527996 RepID=A0A5C6FRQ3_9PLAN|nr:MULTISPECIES: serine/threonine-protein kinase [Crateriforma]TWU64964.1 Serine/threonine-protein kinase PrkC [Crateriforma conspicua]